MEIWIQKLSTLAFPNTWVPKASAFANTNIPQHGPLKSPLFSILFGSIPAFAAIATENPSDCHPMTLATLLYRKFGLGPLHFIDSWPIVGYRQLVINDPVRLTKLYCTYDMYSWIVGLRQILETGTRGASYKCFAPKTCRFETGRKSYCWSVKYAMYRR